MQTDIFLPDAQTRAFASQASLILLILNLIMVEIYKNLRKKEKYLTLLALSPIFGVLLGLFLCFFITVVLSLLTQL